VIGDRSNRCLLVAACCLALSLGVASCDNTPPSADEIQREQQETILKEGTAQTGMPAIRNFTERKLMKDIIELRDQAGLSTFTYSETMSGQLIMRCRSVGYGLPYATQYTSPQKLQYTRDSVRSGTPLWRGDVMPQADPNGLFAPPSAEGTWILCKDPNGTDVKPVYFEVRVIVSPFKLAGAIDPAEVPAARVTEQIITGRGNRP